MSLRTWRLKRGLWSHRLEVRYRYSEGSDQICTELSQLCPRGEDLKKNDDKVKLASHKHYISVFAGFIKLRLIYWRSDISDIGVQICKYTSQHNNNNTTKLCHHTIINCCFMHNPWEQRCNKSARKFVAFTAHSQKHGTQFSLQKSLTATTISGLFSSRSPWLSASLCLDMSQQSDVSSTISSDNWP